MKKVININKIIAGNSLMSSSTRLKMTLFFVHHAENYLDINKAILIEI